MSSTEHFDTIVVGAGIMGSATAYTLQKRLMRGVVPAAAARSSTCPSFRKVLLLEQFAHPLHVQGSSHGESRIIRRSYTQPQFVPLMDQAYSLWSDLEFETNETLINQCGGLMIGETSSVEIQTVLKALRERKVDHEVLSPKALAERFPTLSFPESYTAILEKGAGVVFADRALAAYQRRFQDLGGTLQCDRKVVSITVHSPTHVEVVALDGNEDGRLQSPTAKNPATASHAPQAFTYHASNVVLTVGGWLPLMLAKPRSGDSSAPFFPLLKDLRLDLSLDVQEIAVCYWKTTGADADVHDIKRSFPVFIDFTPADTLLFYGLPAHEHPGCMKFCAHTGKSILVNNRSYRPDPKTFATLQSYVKKHFKALAWEKPEFETSCIYTMTKDENFLLDRHPRHSNVVIGGGFSGHGFKLAPVVGEILSDLVLNSINYDVSTFSLKAHLSAALARKSKM